MLAARQGEEVSADQSAPLRRFRTGPEALCVCRLNAKRPRGFPAGAIRTVDFLLHDLARIVKKVGVKTKDRALGRALINVQMSGFGGLSGNVLFGPSITGFDPKRTFRLCHQVGC